MKRLALLLLAFASMAHSQVMCDKSQLCPAAAAGGTPTLAQFIGKNGAPKTISGSTNAAKFRFWNFDTAGPRVLTSGSMIAMTGIWPNHPTTSNGYHANCTAPCAPAFIDNNSTALTAVFTNGSGCLDSNGFDHNIYYEQNIPSGLTYVEDQFPALITDNAFDGWAFYNVATSGGVDGANGAKCTTNVTPTNNTAPNITGTALTGITSGDLVIVGIDADNVTLNNAVSSITVPSNCYLTDDNRAPGTYGVAHWAEYCIATSTSFTPSFTISQSTHDTFTIYAAAFKAGSGGSAPAAGPGVLLSMQTAFPGNIGSFSLNIGCPTGTTSLVVTDDAGSISATGLSDGTNTFSEVAGGSGSPKHFYSLGMTTTGMPNSYVLTVTVSATGNQDLATFYCTNVTHLDTGFTAGANANRSTMTQVSSSTVEGSVTETTGSSNCEGTAATLVTCTDLPDATPGHSGDLFIMTGVAGTGPILQAVQPSGTLDDSAAPSVIANILHGDIDMYVNGDMAAHGYSTSTSLINWGFKAQQNGAGVSNMVTAFY